MAATHDHSRHHRPHPWRMLKRFLVGQPLRSAELEHQRLSKTVALAVFASDALSSVAYATQEILLVLASAGAIALNFMTPVAGLIAFLLIILVFSYRQTIFAYPNGGGAYIVAKDNLGTPAGLVAGAALLVDYVMTVAVSISSAVDALVSQYPALQRYEVWIALVIVGFVTVANLRGVRESGLLFAVPTYLFVISVLFMVGVGGFRYLTGAPVLPAPGPTLAAEHPGSMNLVGFALVFLVARAFASGCTALTGVEAISNGVSVFREPEAKNAATTMLAMGGLLLVMFLGITWLAQAVHVLPHETQTVLSQLGSWSFGVLPGGAVLHWVLNISTMLILSVAANTSYADFPRLSSIMAQDGFFPRQFANRGDRLVFSNGILLLGLTAAVLLLVFRANTSALIPLYSIGVFTSFTLSQSGMVAHHLKGHAVAAHHDATVPRARGKAKIGQALINGAGAVLTSIVFVVAIATKFTAGAWIVCIVIPLMCMFFWAVHRHYQEVSGQLLLTEPPVLRPVHHRVVVTVASMNRMVLTTLRYATSISADVTAVCVAMDPEHARKLAEKWNSLNLGVPLELLPSPYRSLTLPLMRYLDKVERQHPDDLLTVVLPEFVPGKWWQHLLHNQSALLLKGALLFRKDTVVASVPYHLGDIQ